MLGNLTLRVLVFLAILYGSKIRPSSSINYETAKKEFEHLFFAKQQNKLESMENTTQKSRLIISISITVSFFTSRELFNIFLLCNYLLCDRHSLYPLKEFI